jgi:hypothetical protein
MPLVKSAYKRVDDDEDAPVVPTEAGNTAAQDHNAEKKDPKKRVASFAAESAAKLLKLTENNDTNDLHAVDIASQMLHRHQEQQPKKNSGGTAFGARGLLDLLPTPKSQKLPNNRLSEPEEGDDDTNSLSNNPANDTTKIASPSSTTSILGAVPKPKTKSITPEVHFDESLLAQYEDEELKKASQSAPASVGPVRPVGPARPSYLQTSAHDASEESYEQAILPNAVTYPLSTIQPLAGFNAAVPYIDPVFNVEEEGAQIVEVNVADLVANPVQGAPIPVRNAGSSAARLAGVSRAARGKNQITYLAAIAPDTERIMAEKKSERAKARANSHFR